MPNSCVSRTPWWQPAQVSRARFWSESATLGMPLGALMVWMPWQSVQTGARPLPRAMAWPWMLCT